MDVVYYWKGGVEMGEWHEALPGVWPERKSADELVQDLTRAGFVAHRGNRNVGPPEGPPSADEILTALDSIR